MTNNNEFNELLEALTVSDQFDLIDPYSIETWKLNDVIEHYYDQDEETATATKIIIDSLERDASYGVRNMSVVQIPIIGTFYFNAIQKIVQENKQQIKELRERTNIDEYKSIIGDFMYRAKREILEGSHNTQMKGLIKTNRKYYNKIIKKGGLTNARLKFGFIIKHKKYHE